MSETTQQSELLTLATELQDVLKSMEASQTAAAPVAGAEDLEKAMEPCEKCGKKHKKGEACAKKEEDVEEEKDEAQKALENANLEEMLSKALGDEPTVLRANDVFAELFDITRDAVKSVNDRNVATEAKVDILMKSLSSTMKTVVSMAKALDEIQTAVKTAASTGDGKSKVLSLLSKGKTTEDAGAGADPNAITPTKEQFAKALREHVINDRQYSNLKHGVQGAVTEEVMKKIAAM